MTRLAAVGDIHLGTESRGMLSSAMSDIAGHADVLLVAGDLTHVGTTEEAEVVRGELSDIGVPVIAVLGNHDFQSDQADEVATVLEEGGITLLSGDSVVVDTGNGMLGVAGAKGFGGGFPPAMAAGFGEPEMKAFVAASDREAESLLKALDSLDTETRVALTHYAPVEATLEGERPEIFAFLGSIALAEAIDGGGATLSIHGHAHLGAGEGTTPGGVPVFNVAQPRLDQPYIVLEVDPDGVRRVY